MDIKSIKEMNIKDIDDNDIDSAWSKFCGDEDDDIPAHIIPDDIATLQEFIPKCSPLNISTKTKISYLN